MFRNRSLPSPFCYFAVIDLVWRGPRHEGKAVLYYVCMMPGKSQQSVFRGIFMSDLSLKLMLRIVGRQEQQYRQYVNTNCC